MHSSDSAHCPEHSSMMSCKFVPSCTNTDADSFLADTKRRAAWHVSPGSQSDVPVKARTYLKFTDRTVSGGVSKGCAATPCMWPRCETSTSNASAAPATRVPTSCWRGRRVRAAIANLSLGTDRFNLINFLLTRSSCSVLLHQTRECTHPTLVHMHAWGHMCVPSFPSPPIHATARMNQLS